MISSRDLFPAKRAATQASRSGFGGNILASKGRQHLFQVRHRAGLIGGKLPGAIFERLPQFG